MCPHCDFLGIIKNTKRKYSQNIWLQSVGLGKLYFWGFLIISYTLFHHFGKKTANIVMVWFLGKSMFSGFFNFSPLLTYAVEVTLTLHSNFKFYLFIHLSICAVHLPFSVILKWQCFLGLLAILNLPHLSIHWAPMYLFML